MRGMKRTMDQLGGMAHRAGPGSRTLASSLEPLVEERKTIDSVTESAEGELSNQLHTLQLAWIFEDANEGDFDLADSKENREPQNPPMSSEVSIARPASFGGKPGSLEGQTTRQRSKTVVDRRPLPTSNPDSISQIAASSRKCCDKDGTMMQPSYDDKLLNAEAIGRMIVAAELNTVDPPHPYPLSLEHQEGQTSRRRLAHRKDLEQWLGADAGALPNITDHPAFAKSRGPSKISYTRQKTSSTSHKPSKLPGVSMIRKRNLDFGHTGKAKKISTATGRREGAVLPVRQALPLTMPRGSSYERENARRLEMLQRRRNDTDHPDPGRSKLGYPSKEELKAIQNDIRARTVQGWVKTEDRGAWHGYTLGF